MTIFGTTGNDNLTGTNGDNVFDVSQGGKDFVSGLGGTDVFIFGAAFRGGDEVHGGSGIDTLRLDGDYNFGVDFTATTMEGVEAIELAAAHDYKLTMDNGNVAAGQTLTVNATLLGSGDGLIFDGANELDGMFHVLGGAGNDLITGGALSDIIDLSLGGTDRANGGGGFDNFMLGAALGANDHIDGGLGTDTVTLNGDYSAGLHFKASTMIGVEHVDLLTAHDYKLVFNDGNVAAGALLFVEAHTGVANSVFVDASRETDGHFSFMGGGGNDVIIGSAGADSFNMALSGDDNVSGGLGGDAFGFALGSFGQGDHVDGGDGPDTITITGDYSAGLKITAAQLVNVETMIFGVGNSYKFAITDGVVGAGLALTVFGENLAAGQTVKFDGSAELDGSLTLKGGAGNDILIGGAVNDSLKGNLGADALTGGGGENAFLYQTTAADSTSVGYDTITGFDAVNDDFDLFIAVTGVDAEITTGALSQNHFDSDLTTALSALATQHAVLFTPDTGHFAGHTFLVVNTNGVVGYQTGADIVIEMDGMLNKASLDTTDFH